MQTDGVNGVGGWTIQELLHKDRACEWGNYH